MEHHKIEIRAIKANAASRGEGYVDDVLSSGKIDGDYVYLSDEQFNRIRNKYSPKITHDPEKIKLPPFPTMVKTATESMRSWVKNGATITSTEELESRLNICKQCEFWDEKAFNNTGRCRKCGCSTWAKLRMATEKCPIGKW